MLIGDLIEKIETIAPLHCQENWDMSGVQVSTTATTASKLAICLDATPQAIKTALADNADFILSHHPLSLKPGLPNQLNSYREVLQLLLCANVPLYSAHTSLDCNLSGPAVWLGRELELENTRALEKNPQCPEYGLGLIGNLKRPMLSGKFIDTILGLLSLKSAVLCGKPLPESIFKVAFCGGSGSSLIKITEDLKPDIFITGDIKYHTALDANISILDVGHHGFEEEMMRRLSILLQELLPISVMFIPSQSPFRIIEAGRS